MAFRLVGSLRLHRHEHTFAAFIDIKRALGSCWVEATLVRLLDFGVSGRLWHLLANSLCGTLSQVRLGGSVSPPWVDSGIAQGRILSPLSSSSLLTPFVTSASSMQTTSSFLTASQADLQMALNAVHAWGVRWRFSFGVGPHQVRHHGSLASTGTWVLFSLPPFLGALTSILSLLAGIVSFTTPVLGAFGEGLPLSFSSSLSSPVFSRARHLVSSSLVMIPLPSSSSTSRSVEGLSVSFVCGLQILRVQETQSPLTGTLPVDQPFRYDGPVGSCGREAGLLLHSSIVASPTPGTPDLQSLRWRLISDSLCVCSFYAPHAGTATDKRIQFWRTLAASVHRVSQLHSGVPLLLAVDPSIWFSFFQIGLCGTSLSWPTFSCSLPDSAPSPKSSSTVHPFAHDVAPPTQETTSVVE